MARVTDAEVKEIITTSKNSTPFIDVDNRYIYRILSGKGLSEATLKDIELYMSAHLVSVTTEKGGLKTDRIGDSQRTYSIMSGKGLEMSRYGHTAQMLDTSNTLISAGKKNAVFRAM